jgi:hypothetical protein
LEFDPDNRIKDLIKTELIRVLEKVKLDLQPNYFDISAVSDYYATEIQVACAHAKNDVLERVEQAITNALDSLKD